MRWFLREVRIVEIEIADERAVGERGEIGQRFMIRPPERRAFGGLNRLTDPARDPAGQRVLCSKRTAEAVQDPPLDFVHHGAGQVIVAKRLAIPTQAIREHRLFPPDHYPPIIPHISRSSTPLDKLRARACRGELAEVLTPHELVRPFRPTSAAAFRETPARLLSCRE